MLISWSASGNGPVKDEEGASDMEEVTSINDKEASVLAEDSASNVGDDVAVPQEEPTDEANNVLKNKGNVQPGGKAVPPRIASAHQPFDHLFFVMPLWAHVGASTIDELLNDRLRSTTILSKRALDEVLLAVLGAHPSLPSCVFFTRA